MEYEQLSTLGTIREVGRVGFEAMGESLLLELFVGPPDGPLHQVMFSATVEAAEELQALLRLRLLEKEDESQSRQ